MNELMPVASEEPKLMKNYDITFSEYMHKPRSVAEVMYLSERLNGRMLQHLIEDAGHLRPHVLTKVSLFMRKQYG